VLDGELSALESAALAAHLADCAACRRLADDLRSDDRALRRLTVGRPSEAVRGRIVAAIEAPPVRRRASGGLALLAASVGLVLLGLAASGTASWLPFGPDRTEPAWVRIPAGLGFPVSVGPSAVRALAQAFGADGLSLVAVGSDDRAGRVWRSTDGRLWRTVSDDAAFGRGRPEAVAAAGHRVAVVGSSIDELGAPVATVWISADGTATWRRLTLEGSTGLRAVVMTPSRVLVAGAARSGHGAPLWLSSDGVEWIPVSDGRTFAGAVVTGLALGGPSFVAVGYDDRGAAAWWSTDGLAWERATAPSFTSRRVSAVTASPGGLVAVGFGADGAVAWRSLDGRSWTMTGGFDAALERLSAVAATSSGVMAVGSGPSGPVVWRSDDGRRWDPLDGRAWSAEDELVTIGARGARVVAAGRSGLEAAVWLGEIP
jgi:hypothetical protein